MNLSKNWRLEVERDVFKTLKKMPRSRRDALLHAIKLLPSNPYFGDIQKMKGLDNTWRRRIGAYRIYYKIKNPEGVILVFHLERRTSKTY
ncbi:type II toxin-antitoxin system mRNA interferase toxin, RelE/StbE family [bacterium]|nr:type II toxin-antitoxin system mRNA interferase toxin, RelE/StbE family [bacterium]